MDPVLDVLEHGPSLNCVEMQSALGTPPQNVVTRTRPFPTDEVIDFPCVEACAQMVPEIRNRSAVTQYLRDQRTVATQQFRK
jgi:hypothetical protein